MKLLKHIFNSKPKPKITDLDVLIAGEGGQGVQTIGEILARAACGENLNGSYIPNFGVEQRGGVLLAFIKIGDKKIDYPKFKSADIIVLMTKRAIPRIAQYVSEKTQIIDLIDKDYKPFNMVALGILTNIVQKLGVNLASESVENAIREKLGAKPGLGENISAFKKGLDEKMIKLKKYLPGFRARPADKWKTLTDKFLNSKNSKEKITFVRFPELCKGCGLCIESCPNKALLWSNDAKGVYGGLVPKVNPQKCQGCKTCENICPDCAIRVEMK